MKIVNYCMSLFQKKGKVVKFGTACSANTEPNMPPKLMICIV